MSRKSAKVDKKKKVIFQSKNTHSDCRAILQIGNKMFRCIGGHSEHEYHHHEYINNLGSKRVLHWVDPSQQEKLISIPRNIPFLKKAIEEYKQLEDMLEDVKSKVQKQISNNTIVIKYVNNLIESAIKPLKMDIKAAKTEINVLKKENSRLRLIERSAKRMCKDCLIIRGDR